MKDKHFFAGDDTEDVDEYKNKENKTINKDDEDDNKKMYSM